MATRFTGGTLSAAAAGTRPGLTPRPASRTARDGCPPPCPACGGLECLCRPRFFAGQLLTEQDLNRLDGYIRQKQRLHNRYVHGWGVACGLEVTCDACDDGVRVSAGYALSPCGNDVIVCEDTHVDVCALIRQCDRDRDPAPCKPPRVGQRADKNGCADVEETWVLGICYAEQPSRGVTALRATGSDCGCGCGGGGGGGCGCGGGGHTHGTTSARSSGGCGCGGGGTASRASSRSSTRSSSAGTKSGGCGCGGGASSGSASSGTAVRQAGARVGAAACEPTVICETYGWKVWRAPEGDDTEPRGALVDRAMACLQPYLDWAKALGSAQAPAGGQLPAAQRYRTCCMAKERLRAIIARGPTHDCELLAELDAVVCPSPTLPAADFDTAMDEVGARVVAIWFRALKACLCSALLPPCPPPAADDCIPLATVTVRRSDCHILRVCNWTVHRKFATTVPSLQYWMSILPFGRLLREALDRACCGLFTPRVPDRQPGIANGAILDRDIAVNMNAAPNAARSVDANANPFGAADVHAEPFAAAAPREFSTLLLDAAFGSGTPVDAQTLFRGMGAKRAAEGGRVLRDYERDNLPQYLLASQLMPTLLGSLVPHESASLGGVLGGLFGGTARRAARMDSEGGDDVVALRRELDQLRATVEQQQALIGRLSDRLDNR